MTPRWHPPEELLFEYATGTAAAAVELFVATHLALCPACRGDVDDLEALGGMLLEGTDGVDAPLPDLADLPDRAVVPPAAAEGALWIPEPLRSLVGEPSWSSVVPGLVWELELPFGLGGTPARLTRARAGFRVPQHTHKGLELNLVLAGGFHDADDGFGRGDVAANDESRTHSIEMDRGEDCVLLVVNEHPLVPVGLWSGLLSVVSGRF
jgi:putative transcriptional regulator